MYWGIHNMVDTPDLYRLNVQEIVSNWGGYLLDVPCSNNQPAINAGIIELRCFINNGCPFSHVSPTEAALVFNERTLERLIPFFPQSFQNTLTTTPGTEGVHFRPRYVFRNNYLYQRDTDGNFEEIDGTGSVLGADQSLYDFEQAWNVEESVFDPGTTAEEGSNECIKSDWRYRDIKITDTEMGIRDVKFDYPPEFYSQWFNSIERDKNGQIVLKKGVKPKFLHNKVQMPEQLNIVDRFGQGVHWRLEKRTPLYRGEDFFIRFYKTAKASTINKVSPEGIPFSNKFPRYKSLDINCEDFTTLGADVLSGSVTNPGDFEIPVNLAFKRFSKDPEFNKKYDFSSQAYYIVELGANTLDDNYFIIIPERANPLFVHLMPSDQPGKFVSRILGECNVASGEQLIKADYFTMTVRNHLQEIIVEFATPSGKSSPWKISRRDWDNISLNESTGKYQFDTKSRHLYVPRGHITIWGGNLKCGFVFGPLQYVEGSMGFVYPPRQVGNAEEIGINFNGSATEITGPPIVDGDGNETGVNDNLLEEMTNPFSLPYGSNHHILFNASNVNVDTLYKDVSRTGNFINNQLMFTQDAQFYENYNEGRRKRPSVEFGSYFHGDTIKEISLSYFGKSTTIANVSGFKVFKYRYYNDIRSHHQLFDTVIYMQCGDHIFGVGHYEGAKVFPGWGIDNSNLVTEPGIWYLPDCKTPIITGMRLIADESDDPRWDDGTTMRSGMALTPFDNSSPYLLDVTDHVLNYSESWSASMEDFSSIDHTGTINFLLNTKMAIPVNYTDALYSLQNKTFYIDIWAGYRPCSYSKTVGFYKLFTGLCKGGSVEYQYGNINIMTCKVEDYTAVLKEQFFFNSPFFDGMRDINAVNEVMNLAGFRGNGPFDPNSLIRNLSNYSDTNGSQVFFRHVDGRLFKMEPYTLPSGYQRLEQPEFKFKDGENYLDAIRKFTLRSSKTFFFDQLGIAHYEDFQDLIQLDYLGQLNLAALYKFTTNPEIFPGQLVFNKFERKYEVESTYNHIKFLSSTPNMEVLVRDALNWQSIDDPTSEGFIGYMKTFYQQEGMFGSKEAVDDAVNKYSVMFRPAMQYTFETYGLPLRANDMISINGEIARVMKVNHELDPSQQRWWMSVECLRFSPVDANY